MDLGVMDESEIAAFMLFLFAFGCGLWLAWFKWYRLPEDKDDETWIW